MRGVCGGQSVRSRRGARAKSPRNREPVPRAQGTKNLRRLADGEEAAEPVPVVPEPVEAEQTAGAIPAEVGHVPVAVRVDPGRAEADDRELPLDFGKRGSERQELLDRRRTHPFSLEVGEHLLGAGSAVEVDKFEGDRNHTRAADGEVLRSDVVVLPVVATSRHHLLDGLPVVQLHGVARVAVGKILSGDAVLLKVITAVHHILVLVVLHGGGHRRVLAVGVQEELLQVLPSNPTRFVLCQKLRQLVCCDPTHLPFSLASAVKQFYTRHHYRAYYC